MHTTAYAAAIVEGKVPVEAVRLAEEAKKEAFESAYKSAKAIICHEVKQKQCATVAVPVPEGVTDEDGHLQGAGYIRIFFPDRGYGFASPDDGSDDVYLYVADSANLEYYTGGERVIFEFGFDPRKGKHTGAHVRQAHKPHKGANVDRTHKPRQGANGRPARKQYGAPMSGKAEVIARCTGRMSRTIGIQPSRWQVLSQCF